MLLHGALLYGLGHTLHISHYCYWGNDGLSTGEEQLQVIEERVLVKSYNPVFYTNFPNMTGKFVFNLYLTTFSNPYTKFLGYSL